MVRPRKPLTSAELARLWDRAKTPEDRRLIREIHGLRELVRLLADMYERRRRDPSKVELWREAELAHRLSAEPLFTDPPTPRQWSRMEAAERDVWLRRGYVPDRLILPGED